jgi:head-tail adaptor
MEDREEKAAIILALLHSISAITELQATILAQIEGNKVQSYEHLGSIHAEIKEAQEQLRKLVDAWGAQNAGG